MSAQPLLELIDAEESRARSGRELRDEAFSRVLSNTPEDYKRAFADAVARFPAGRTFTVEDVTEVVGRPPAGVHYNSVGALVSALAKRGLMVSTGRMLAAARPGMHATKLAEWRRTEKRA